MLLILNIGFEFQGKFEGKPLGLRLGFSYVLIDEGYLDSTKMTFTQNTAEMVLECSKLPIILQNKFWVAVHLLVYHNSAANQIWGRDTFITCGTFIQCLRVLLWLTKAPLT